MIRAKDADDMDDEVRLLRLEQAGIVVRRGRGSPLDVLGTPLRAGADLMQALLEERFEELRDGDR